MAANASQPVSMWAVNAFEPPGDDLVCYYHLLVDISECVYVPIRVYASTCVCNAECGIVWIVEMRNIYTYMYIEMRRMRDILIHHLYYKT